jgi:hypothetical protein
MCVTLIMSRTGENAASGDTVSLTHPGDAINYKLKAVSDRGRSASDCLLASGNSAIELQETEVPRVPATRVREQSSN